MQEEENIVRRAQQKDAEAFAHLYEAYFDKIFRYVRLKLRSQNEAEDLTQQVFLNAFQSISTYQQRGIPFSSWLFRIAHNQVVDYWRKTSRQKTSPLQEARIEMDPILLAEQQLTLERLTVASHQLSSAQQEVLSLRFAAGLSIAEAAKAMGKSPGAIKTLQHSALVRLRQILAEEDKSFRTNLDDRKV